MRCGYCGAEVGLEARNVRGEEVKRNEVAFALLTALGIGATETKTEYRIYCPSCNRAVGQFVSAILDI